MSSDVRENIFPQQLVSPSLAFIGGSEQTETQFGSVLTLLMKFWGLEEGKTLSV